MPLWRLLSAYSSPRGRAAEFLRILKAIFSNFIMRPILGWDLRETRTQVDGAACQVLFASKSVGKRRDFGVEPGIKPRRLRATIRLTLEKDQKQRERLTLGSGGGSYRTNERIYVLHMEGFASWVSELSIQSSGPADPWHPEKADCRRSARR
jgi:hypothetical protein